MFKFIKRIWRKLFPLYFKIRLRLFSKDRGWYIIEYNQGGFNPTWEELVEWHHIDDPSYSGMCWNPVMGEYVEMEEYAKGLTSMKEVRRHYDREYGIRLKQLTKRKEYLNKFVGVKDVI